MTVLRRVHKPLCRHKKKKKKDRFKMLGVLAVCIHFDFVLKNY